MAFDVPTGAGFAYTTSLRSLDEQLRRIEALDSKAGILLAADGVLAGFLFTRGSVLLDVPGWIGILAAIAILVSMTLALLAFASRNYVTAPRAQAVALRAAAPEDWLEWRFLPNVLRAIDVNAPNLARKARFVGLSVLSLLVGVLTTGAYLGYAIVTD